MIICSGCGHANGQGDAFCGSCGGFLEWDGEPVAAVPAPRPALVEAPRAALGARAAGRARAAGAGAPGPGRPRPGRPLLRQLRRGQRDRAVVLPPVRCAAGRRGGRRAAAAGGGGCGRRCATGSVAGVPTPPGSAPTAGSKLQRRVDVRREPEAQVVAAADAGPAQPGQAGPAARDPQPGRLRHRTDPGRRDREGLRALPRCQPGGGAALRAGVGERCDRDQRADASTTRRWRSTRTR